MQKRCINTDFPILLPKDIDISKWAVIACDQFNATPEYWYKLEKFVNGEPSTLNLIFPEVYLNQDKKQRIEKINTKMVEYVNTDLFSAVKHPVLVERTLLNGKKRIGIVLSIDIEDYEFSGIESLIRPTEDTIMERLPIRVQIRESAKLELPHTLLLVDDREKTIIEPIYEKHASLKKLYECDLNMNGGHIVGYEAPFDESMLQKFDKLLDAELQTEKYGKDAGLLFTVGDGNHSIATAKVLWNKIKVGLTEDEKLNHPSRYFLLEVINIYDDSLEFHSINRIVYNADSKFVKAFQKNVKGNGSITLLTKEKTMQLPCPEKASECIKAVQEFLEEYVKHSDIEIEYVHGENHLKEVVVNYGGVGIIMPEFDKKDLFSYVINVGNLPKKAFSIGAAEEKRYYLEAKIIK